MLIVGSTWEEKARPGHMVIITRVSDPKWRGDGSVIYRHVGVHNKRAQSHPTLSAMKNFRKRFKLIKEAPLPEYTVVMALDTNEPYILRESEWVPLNFHCIDCRNDMTIPYLSMGHYKIFASPPQELM
jgi:hypothetical protein